MEEITEQKNPVCLSCKNYLGDWKCNAFDEIPIEILRGENEHEKPLDGQTNDIVYEPKGN